MIRHRKGRADKFLFRRPEPPTQMRNTAAARIGRGRLVIAGLVDTSGYSTEISGKYQGFFITDSPVRVGGKCCRPVHMVSAFQRTAR